MYMTEEPDYEKLLSDKDEEIKRLRLWLALMASLGNGGGVDDFISNGFMVNSIEAIRIMAVYARFGLSGACNLPVTEAAMCELHDNGLVFIRNDTDKIVFEDAWLPHQ